MDKRPTSTLTEIVSDSIFQHKKRETDVSLGNGSIFRYTSDPEYSRREKK